MVFAAPDPIGIWSDASNYEALHKVIEGIAVRDQSHLHDREAPRYGDVSRITNEIDDPRIARIEGFMSFKNPRRTS